MLNSKEADAVVTATVRAHQAEQTKLGRSASIFPVWCEGQAEAAEQINEWVLAAIWWRYASGYSLGRSRAQGYEAAAQLCDLRAKEAA